MEHQNILPQIKTKEFISKEEKGIVYNEFLSNLITCYVEDDGSTMSYITKDRLNELTLDSKSLHDFALKNLLNLSGTKDGIHIMNNGEGTQSISFETHDSYDSSRILLLFGPLLDKFIEIIGDPFLVAIPYRDFLIAVPPIHEARLSEYTEQLFHSKENPITKELFLFSKKEATFKS